MDVATLYRNRTYNHISTLLGKMDPTTFRRNAFEVGSGTLWNGNLESTFATNGFGIQYILNRSKPVADILME
jgi:hypothetical protein